MASTTKPTEFRRALGLRHLLIYGIVMVQPTAPMPVYGVVSQTAKGHVVPAILIAMVAMLFTAISYGRMARAYPSAGSAYSYVSHTLHPAAGYLTGWSIALDYFLNPTICVIWCSKAAANFVPDVPYWVLAVCFAAIFTYLNLRGIETSARASTWLAASMGTVVILFLAYAVHYVLAQPGLTPTDFWRPFYDPKTFSFATISAGTAIAVMTYIGFDGISTLSEEVEDPRRNILLATVLTCLITGILSSIESYAGQMVWPDYSSYPDVDTAFVYIAGRAGGHFLFALVNLTLLVASIGSGFGGQLAAARLLFSMGRNNAIPRGFFGKLDPVSQIPRNNVFFTSVIVLIGALSMSYQFGAEMVNFGAFIAFMSVNISCFLHYCVRLKRRTWQDWLPPIAGLLVCFYIWLNLSTWAKIAGFAWLAVGLLYGRLRNSWQAFGSEAD